MQVEMVVRLTPNEGDAPQELTVEQAEELYAQLGAVLQRVPVVTPVDTKPAVNTLDTPPVPVMPSALPKAFAGKALPLQTPPPVTETPANPTEAPPAG